METARRGGIVPKPLRYASPRSPKDIHNAKHPPNLMRPCRPKTHAAFAAILLATAAGCKHAEPQLVSNTLEVQPASLSFAYDETGIPKRIGVETNAAAFRFSVNYADAEAEWLETALGEACITVSATSANRSEHDRSATVTVTADRAEPCTVTVTQRAQGSPDIFSITLSPELLEFPADGDLTGEANVVTAGSGLSARTETDDTWYTARMNGNKVVVEAAPNTAAARREGCVTVTNAQGGSAVLAIGQAGMPETFDIVLDPASLTFAASGDGLTKTVTVATQGTGITTETTADCAEWLAAAAEGNRITVTAAINYGGERSGRITVRNTEGASAPLEVTQKAAGDDGIALEPRKLTFGPEGGSKNCAIVTEGTGLTAETDAGSTAWLAASAEGALLTVSVAPWDGSGLRSGTVTVRNAEGGEAVLAIEQSGTETADLSGTWQWSSRCTTDEGWEDAVTVSGTAFVVRDGDGYTITGIAGAGIRRLGATEPEMHLVLRNGRAGISYGEAFEKDGIRYYSAAQLSFPSGIIKAWTATETFAEITVEETTLDGRRCERMTLPDLLAADSALFPDKAQLWGETGEVCYIYYETMRIGGSEIPVPIEYHRNIVLTRECP